MQYFRAELKAEKGHLKVDGYIDRESAILVFREFGGSKRLSEMEKKEIQGIVALRTQCAKEVSSFPYSLCIFKTSHQKSNDMSQVCEWSIAVV